MSFWVLCCGVVTNQGQYTFPDAGLYALHSILLGMMMVARYHDLSCKQLIHGSYIFSPTAGPKHKAICKDMEEGRRCTFARVADRLRPDTDRDGPRHPHPLLQH